MITKEKDNIRKSGKLRVAAYIRVSTDMTDQENSYETQERYFKWLLSNNEEWISAGVYSDYDISGTSMQKRTGFRRILRHCREGRIDSIVTKSISRFARNTADFMLALNVLHETGTTILFEKEGLDTASSASDFILITLAAIAQEESRSISSNINWGNQKRFLRGDVRNQDIYGYRFTNEYITTESGYCYKAVEIVEEEAEIVRWIFGSYIDGMTFQEIARNLNFRNIPHKLSFYAKKRMENSAKGQLNSDIDEGWTSEQIGAILRNERYTGDVLAQKTYTEDYLNHKVRVNKGEAAQYWIYDHHPAIISRELFEEVQKLREINISMRSHYSKRTFHAFSGRLICGNCGRYYNIRNTDKHPIWFCPSAARNNGKSICHSERVYEEQIVLMFRKAISERFHLISAPSGGATDFVGQMLARLENMQRMDFIEWDRALMKREIMAAKASDKGSCRRARLLRTQKEMLESQKLVLKDVNIPDTQIIALEEKINAEEKKQAAAKAELNRLIEQLEYMENYWEELEKGHECRNRAIEWMKSLPQDKNGVIEFLNGMTDTYVQAFILSITIHDPLHYTVHWFDDIRTEVEMYTNIEEDCYTTAHFDGRMMCGKKSGKAGIQL